MKLTVGTDKGLLVYEQQNGTWTLLDIHFTGMPIGAFHVDFDQNWWVAINHKHWGPKLYISTDKARTFSEVDSPKFSINSRFTLKSIWTIYSQKPDDLGRIFVGVEPAALFFSNDKGKEWQELTGLSNHFSRSQWQGGGKGSNSPFLHTIITNPNDPRYLLVGISCAGIFQSFDDGLHWTPTNNGMKAFYLPDTDSLVGHDPHSICRSKTNADVLWQQNHCGIYRSDDGGLNWRNITDRLGKAEYGFAMVIAEDNDNEAWVIPATSDQMRIPHMQQLAVYRTTDVGKTWKAFTEGLPYPSFDLVLRDAMDLHDKDIAFGTNNGNLYISNNKGHSWKTISQNLSAVRCVNFI